ncbi:MAG: response regulator [Deltaproteobacteria bacterium]|nr:response regulator [Deltaproteobacteria bacterium]
MRKTTVMLVDDEAPFVETMTKRLAKRGLGVEAAYSGQEALDKLQAEAGKRVDVVILDVKMPGLDGLETLTAIKHRHPLIEVVMLTGHATVESAIEGMKRGAFDYLMKPSDMEVLMAKVEEACQRKRQHETRILEAKAQMIAHRRGD